MIKPPLAHTPQIPVLQNPRDRAEHPQSPPKATQLPTQPKTPQ